MIFDSVLFMTAIDLIIIVAVFIALWSFYRRRRALRQFQAFKSLILVLLGMILIAAFYLLDLFAMLFAPMVMENVHAMDLMEYLHLEVSWIVNLMVVGLMVVGILHLNRILQDVGTISGAAMAVEADEFEPEMLADVTKRPDEVGNLGRVFQQMAQTVYAREEQLRQEVQQLRIKINRSKQDQQVAEITESDFFQELQAKAAELRRAAADSDA